eukprot:362149-Rhodomonas_salina.1
MASAVALPPYLARQLGLLCRKVLHPRAPLWPRRAHGGDANRIGGAPQLGAVPPRCQGTALDSNNDRGREGEECEVWRDASAAAYIQAEVCLALASLSPFLPPSLTYTHRIALIHTHISVGDILSHTHAHARGHAVFLLLPQGNGRATHWRECVTAVPAAGGATEARGPYYRSAGQFDHVSQL